jgi:DNA mismatch repair protein MSH4
MIGIFKYLMPDAVTIRNMELLNNLSDKKSKKSLFGVLDHSQTAMGSRFLRTSILQPNNDLATIESRLDCVQELVINEVNASKSYRIFSLQFKMD